MNELVKNAYMKRKIYFHGAKPFVFTATNAQRERERERERGRQTDRQRQRQRDRDRGDRQTDRRTDRQTQTEKLMRSEPATFNHDEQG